MLLLFFGGIEGAKCISEVGLWGKNPKFARNG